MAALADPGEMIDRDDVEAVVVCSPPATHAAVAEAALARDRHLYLEKPIAIDLPAARRLEEAEDSARAVSATGFSYRFNPAFARLRERVRSGEISRVREARCLHFEPALPGSAPAWKTSRRDGGGVALDLLSHSIDTARWLLADEVAAVEEAVAESGATGGEELRARIRMRGGVAIDAGCSYLRGRGHRWELIGEEGVLIADRWPPLVRRRRRPSRGITALRRGLLAVPIPRRERSFALALRRFVAAARGDPRGELATIEDGARSLAAVLEAERVAREETLPA